MNSKLMHRIEESLTPPTRFVGDGQRWRLDTRMAHYAVPGVSAAVFGGGELVASAAYGVRANGNAATVDESTRFQAASMSKVVTAFMVMQQVERGRITLDDDVNRYLRSWRVPDSPLTVQHPVTLRRILTHRAGLTVHGFRGYPRRDPIPDVVTVLRGEDGVTGPVLVDIPPDSQQRYSGGGTTVAQLLLEEVTGVGFADLAKASVFGPLGLTRSTFVPLTDDSAAANVAVGHRSDGSPVVDGWHNFAQLGAAGLWTTAVEFGRFFAEIHRAWHGRSKLLSAALAHEMLTPPYNDQRGLGPMVYGTADNPRFFHDGDNQGFHCAATCYAGSGQGAVVLTNGDLGPALWREILAGIATTCDWPGFLEPAFAVHHLDPSRLHHYAGEYRITAGYEGSNIVVRMVGDALEGSIEGIPTRKLLPISATDFRSRETPFTTRFTIDRSGQANRVQILDGEEVLIVAQREAT